MPDTILPPSLVAPALLALAPTLGAAFLAGAITQLARQLAHTHLLPARAISALAVVGGIAALTVIALLSTLPQAQPPELLLAAACITGWSGPKILTRLGSLLERRLGLGGADTLGLGSAPEREQKHR